MGRSRLRLAELGLVVPGKRLTARSLCVTPVRAGSRMGDLCTWLWCSPCALCQETRTLWANNVAEGVWHGPAQQQLLPATSPPPAQAVAGALVAPKTG